MQKSGLRREGVVGDVEVVVVTRSSLLIEDNRLRWMKEGVFLPHHLRRSENVVVDYERDAAETE